MLALSIKTIQKLVRDKQIVAYRIGGRYLIRESDLIDIEKTFEQTIEYDLLKLMQKLENEMKDHQGRQQLIYSAKNTIQLKKKMIMILKSNHLLKHYVNSL